MARAKTAEDLEAENRDTIRRLQEKREEINALKHQEATDVAFVQAELTSKQLAEEEARLDAALEAQRERVGVDKVREARPALSSEVDERLAEEAKVANEAAVKAAEALTAAGGLVNPETGAPDETGAKTSRKGN